jgi:hypothetical protein
VTCPVDYGSFLTRKLHTADAEGIDSTDVPDWLFGFQQDLVTWALRQGRAAIFADCGLGKTPMQLVWADNIRRHTGRPVLIVTPLAVGSQTVGEAAKFGIEAAVSRHGKPTAPITVTNYERLERFDPDDFGGVVCDESSAIKSFDGMRRKVVTEFLRTHRYRLLCTATAAPNDYTELGTSSEALGYLGHMDMLGRFFVNDQRTSKAVRRWTGNQWRFKGHAEEPFWKWVASWARAARRPSDLGYEDEGFALPDLIVNRHIVDAVHHDDARLFDLPAADLREQRAESRRTIEERCDQAAALLEDAPSAVAWCQLNDEGDRLSKIIDGAVQVSGSDDPDAKEEALEAFSRGEVRVLVTKPSIGAWGLNWQHCHRTAYFPSHSYEQWYQAVRRFWRFGQTEPVTVDVVTTDGGIKVLNNLERKANQASRMFDRLVFHMREAVAIDRSTEFTAEAKMPTWL